MKTPRITDFDPAAQAPALGSPLEGMPAIALPTAKPQPEPVVLQPDVPSPVVTPQPAPPGRASARPSGVPPVRTPVRRTLTRYAFEFFQDQIERLKAASLEEKLAGGKGSMSAMVRAALDQFLASRRGGEE